MISKVSDYYEGVLNGEVVYYIDGKYEHTRYYDHGKWTSYSYKIGGEVITKNVENATAEVETYWDNGKLARKFSIENGWVQGNYVSYYENGQLRNDVVYVNDWRQGEDIWYFPNGNIKYSGVRLNDNFSGTVEYFSRNGNIKERMTFKDGDLTGLNYKYNEKGELIKTIYYYNGNEVLYK